MTIQGLSEDWLYVNNPIYIRIYNFGANVPLNVILTLTTNTESKTMKYYPFDGEIIFDIAPLIKSMFRKPINNLNYTGVTNTINTIQKFTILLTVTYSDNSTETQTYTRRFIRGGKIGQKNNVQASLGSINYNGFIPVWDAYPVAYYLITNHVEGRIRKIPIDSTLSSWANYELDFQIRKLQVKSADGAYIKYLNQSGGYSYWLFEVNESKVKTKDSDYYIRPHQPGGVLWESNMIATEITDMGTKVEKTISVTSTVHSDYIDQIEQLIYSNDIWLFDKNENEWYKLLTSSNSINKDNNKQAYEVSFTFDLYQSLSNTLL